MSLESVWHKALNNKFSRSFIPKTSLTYSRTQRNSTIFACPRKGTIFSAIVRSPLRRTAASSWTGWSARSSFSYINTEGKLSFSTTSQRKPLTHRRCCFDQVAMRSKFQAAESVVPIVTAGASFCIQLIWRSGLKIAKKVDDLQTNTFTVVNAFASFLILVVWEAVRTNANAIITNISPRVALHIFQFPLQLESNKQEFALQ